ncbi:MAG: hypothetical protein JWP88_855, partial [Flaviaesturariibacter sp.]|nr:hypothetical protein [Flaviaesturariibacter sp.]
QTLPMKPIQLSLLSFFFCFLFLFGEDLYASVPPVRLPADSLSVAKAYTILKNGSNKQIAELIGRRLTGKEKLSLWAARRFAEVDEATQKKANSRALIGFLLSLAGLLLIPLLPSIAAIVLTNSALKMEREQPGALSKNKDLAQIGFVIGIIGVAICFLLLLLILSLSSLLHR